MIYYKMARVYISIIIIIDGVITINFEIWWQ